MPATDLDRLIDAAKASAEIAKKYWRANPETWVKPDGAGPVTEADLKIDKMLHAELRAARPDYGWLSEETEDDTARLNHDTLFVIDPIDGTRSFMAGERTWSHSLAVVRNGKPVAGVVYLPLRDKLYVADETNATLNGAPIKSGADVTLTGATILAAKPNTHPEHWQGGDVPAFDRHFRTSLAYRLSLVGEGRFDAMLTLRKAWEWDIAAGALIAQTAGATITDRTEQSLVFNNREPLLNGVVCASSQLHSEITSRLA